MHRGSHGSSSVDVHTEKEHRESQKEQKENKEPGSGRPRAGSESRNPVSKVMDLIRHRSHSALSAEDKRKAVSGRPHRSSTLPGNSGRIYIRLSIRRREIFRITFRETQLNVSTGYTARYVAYRIAPMKKMPELYFY